MARGRTGRAVALVVCGLVLDLAGQAVAGTDDLGSVGGIDYRARSNSSPIMAGGVSVGPDAECLGADRPAGGGIAIGGDEALINRSSTGGASLASAQSWVAVWTNLAGASKTATVIAECVDKRVVRVRETRNVDGGKARKIEAACPRGTHVSGGGGLIEGSNTLNYVHSSYPVDGHDRDSKPDDGWKVRVRNGDMGTVSATAEAHCVEFEPSYRVAKPQDIDDGAFADSSASCRGAHVLGGGVRIGGTAAEAHPVIMAPQDGGDADLIPDDRFLVYAGNVAGTDHKPLTAYAVCKG
jgi:hypothetical protein